MRAIIIGAGIGGPVAALALQRAGIEAAVYEAHNGAAESLGLFLGLGINGMRVLRDLAALDFVMQTGPIPTPSIVFSSSSGRRLGSVLNGWLDSGTPSITLMRGTLQRALAEAAGTKGIEIQYGKRFIGYENTTSGVAASFDDGTHVEADVLIGSDGIHSRVRAVMAPESPGPSYTGLLNLGGVVRDSSLPPTVNEMRMVWGRRAFFGYTVRPGGEAWWFANVGMRSEPQRQDLAVIPTAEWKRRLQELFAGDPCFIADLVERTGTIGATPIHDMPSLPAWRRGRVALIGDAAHAVSPSAGQGASLAMEDGLMLAKCLRDVSPSERALERYEQLRRRRAEKIVAEGRRRGSYKAIENRLALTLRDLLMPLAFRLFATRRATSWIHDYEIAWDERVA
jgi:FAD-dependent urate hydroxylase